MKHPRAILFDNDGVLIASEPLHWNAWEALLAELGLPYNNAEMRTFVGKTAPEIILALLNKYSPGWDRARHDLVALAQRKNDIYLKLAHSQLSAYPGVVEGLKWLRARGIKTAVVTNAKRRELEASMKITGLGSLIDLHVSRDDVSAPKPDPAPYLYAAACLAAKPSECIVVEDSPTGLEAALMGKIPAAAVMTNFPASSLQTPVPGRPNLMPIWVGADPAEFFGWLKTAVEA
jgi:HAD superfamily hydrolase (TIGR01509 family)